MIGGASTSGLAPKQPRDQSAGELARGALTVIERGTVRHHSKADSPALLQNSYAGVGFGIEVEDDRTAAEAG
jgi:hypothetical protein